MKYLYRWETNSCMYYTDRILDDRTYSGTDSIHDASVRNDPDDFLLGRREMEAYGYELVIMTDKEYFLARLCGRPVNNAG